MDVTRNDEDIKKKVVDHLYYVCVSFLLNSFRTYNQACSRHLIPLRQISFA